MSFTDAQVRQLKAKLDPRYVAYFPTRQTYNP
jgi:hypothetical protein